MDGAKLARTARRIRLGRRVKLREGDYLYGDGTVDITPTRILATGLRRTADDVEWVEVSGLQYDWRGALLGERTVCVRAEALSP